MNQNVEKNFEIEKTSNNQLENSNCNSSDKLSNTTKLERLQNEVQSSINQYQSQESNNQKCLLDLETMKQVLNQILVFGQNVQSIIDYNLNIIIEKANIAVLDIIKFATNGLESQDSFECLIKNFQQQISESIWNLQKSLNNSAKLLKTFNQFPQENDQSYCIQETTKQDKNLSQQKRYEYRIHSSQNLDKECTAIAFNCDSSIMIAGVEGNIIVYQFNDNKLKESSLLQGDSSRVEFLQFMNIEKNKFISASSKNEITIWEQNKNKEYKINKILKGHLNSIRQVVINNSDDYFVSSSIDKTIKFWSRSLEWSCSQTITFSSYVYSISLNTSEIQLIVSEANNLISVIEQSQSQWYIKAQISVSQFGSKLCFLGEDEFSFQQYNGKLLCVYKYDYQKQKYSIKQELTVMNGVREMFSFPQYFNHKKGFLVSKNCEFIFLITKRNNSDYLIDQTIQFDSSSLVGGVSQDGNYLAIWDQSSKQLQIRKLCILE